MRNTSLFSTVAACIASIVVIFIYVSMNSLFSPFSSAMLREFNEWSYIQIAFVCAVITNLYGYYIFVFGKGKESALNGHSGPFIFMLCIIVISMSPISLLKFDVSSFLMILIPSPYYFALRYIYADIQRIYGIKDD